MIIKPDRPVGKTVLEGRWEIFMFRLTMKISGYSIPYTFIPRFSTNSNVCYLQPIKASITSLAPTHRTMYKKLGEEKEWYKQGTSRNRG
jgi:hypothetical protein